MSISIRMPGFPHVLVIAAAVALPATAFAAPASVQLLVPMGFFASVVIVVALVVAGYHRYTVQRHETLRAMVDKGMQIPPEQLGPGARPPGPRTDIRRGVLLICAGLGTALFLAFEEGPREAGLGLIPGLVGVGYLVLAKLESARETSQPSLS
jgi:hypothetical protein